MAVVEGLTACAVSVLFFGSMFVPIKKFDAGDGFFTQWIMSSAILSVGFIVFAYVGFPSFFPLAMLGGAFWTIGNAMAIPIINQLGMALGILIWNTTNCLTGWAGGRFGLFGMNAHPPASSFLNYLGLSFVLIGGVIFSSIKNNTEDNSSKTSEGARITLHVESGETEKLNSGVTSEDESLDKAIVIKPQKTKSRFIGIAMALISGCFYGITFVPVTVMQDNKSRFPNYPSDGMSYIFSHYFGIFLTATVIFLGYSVRKRCTPVLNGAIVLPAFASGLLWAIAQSSFFVANDNLSQAVTFPIITTLPGCVAALWSILYFGEIKGRRNLTMMAAAMGITLTGAVLVGLSKTVQL